MSQRLAVTELAQIATVTERPVLTKVDRNFGLPTGLYVATVGLYLGFLAVMSVAFINPELAIPMVIFAFFIVAAFGVAGFWAKMQPANDTRPLSWGQFSSRGIQTETGHIPAGAAIVQVLILPVLILVWGMIVAVIAALH
jgi:hypothetical protein